MNRTFNTDGYCDPELNYMVDLTSRLEQIKEMVDAEKYFTINRARQYGKTTILMALSDYLNTEYNIISLDFQGISYEDFTSEQRFVAAFSRQVLTCGCSIPEDVQKNLELYATGRIAEATLSVLFVSLQKMCRESEKKIVLIIDEVDSATNNQVFIDFLAQLRFYYLKRRKIPVFQSVILAGVYDVRNIKRKIRPDEQHKQNSPWNIAAKFPVDMSFSIVEIGEMLKEYESDYHTGMNIKDISELLYNYTSGYPYLVSSLCKYLDEDIAGGKDFPDKKTVWTKNGVLEAVKRLLSEKNPLFESLTGKLNDFPELKNMIFQLLFRGQAIAYNADDAITDMLIMFGFAKVKQGTVQISNRIFETRLYNYFLTLPEVQNGDMYKLALQSKNQFIQNGQLDMNRLLKKFVEHFDDIYGDQNQKFIEEDGRRYFMLYLKPIINGIGNYYIESRTRNQERTDLIIDYQGTQYIIEMKIWHGNSYNERGEKQLRDYLDYYHLTRGYMLSFNFNKKKEIGIKEIILGDKTLIEAVV